MHPGTDLPLPKPEHLHPRLHWELATISIPVNPIYYRGKALVMDRERGRYPDSSTLILLFLGKSAPLRSPAHEVLGKNQPTILTDGLPLIKVFDEVDTATLRTNMNPRRFSPGSRWRCHSIPSSFPARLTKTGRILDRRLHHRKVRELPREHI